MASNNEFVDWIPLSLTHVLYPKGDLLGEMLALISLTPFAIVVAFVTLTLFVRDIHTIFFFCGQLTNEIICLVLKRLFRHSRPIQVLGRPHSNQSYGMPSQHSQFQSFFTFYCLLFFIFRLKRKPLYFRSLLTFAVITLFIGVLYSRIYLLYHYWTQCIVGIVVGFVFALIWYWIINFVLEPYLFGYILQMKISRYFGLCDVYIDSQKDKKLKYKS